MSAWSDVSSFDFVAVDNYLNSCIDRGEGQFSEGSTSVDFSEFVCDSEFGENILAVTLIAGTRQNPQCTGRVLITDADIVFNSAEAWDVYNGPLRRVDHIEHE
jgi:hypothetical protein